jgi:hypothetical protein
MYSKRAVRISLNIIGARKNPAQRPDAKWPSCPQRWKCWPKFGLGMPLRGQGVVSARILPLWPGAHVATTATSSPTFHQDYRRRGSSNWQSRTWSCRHHHRMRRQCPHLQQDGAMLSGNPRQTLLRRHPLDGATSLRSRRLRKRLCRCRWSPGHSPRTCRRSST